MINIRTFVDTTSNKTRNELSITDIEEFLRILDLYQVPEDTVIRGYLEVMVDAKPEDVQLLFCMNCPDDSNNSDIIIKKHVCEKQ